jgi:sortase B
MPDRKREEIKAEQNPPENRKTTGRESESHKSGRDRDKQRAAEEASLTQECAADLERERRRKKRLQTGRLLTAGIVICLLIMAYAGFRLISTLIDYKKGTDEYNKIRSYTTEESASSGDPAEALSAEMVPPIQVDWASLQKINPEIVGWLYIGALDLSYPVVQTKDNDFYLHRTFEKQYNFAGTIFVECKNNGDFKDPNTIVYGHNMLNGSMFGKLSHLLSEKRYMIDSYFWVLTPGGNYRYRMFGMKTAAVEDDTYTIFHGTGDIFTDWCSKMYQSSEVPLKKCEFRPDSKVVTLSTCTNDPGHRFVVQGIADPAIPDRPEEKTEAENGTEQEIGEVPEVEYG